MPEAIVREATVTDDRELQRLQARCPQGAGVVVSTVNTPDFFARSRVYESARVLVASSGDRILGSAAYAVRPALVRGRARRIAHVFQVFTAPELRRSGVARLLLEEVRQRTEEDGVAFSYGLVMEGNRPSFGLVERLGFQHHRASALWVLPVFRKIPLQTHGRIRPATRGELPEVAREVNRTWEGHELFEPSSAEALARRLDRTPGCSLGNLYVLEGSGKAGACLGFWDWSRVTRVTLLRLSTRMRATALLMRAAGCLRPGPTFPAPGAPMRQIMLTPVAFREGAALADLIRHVNNQALDAGIRQIFCVCDPASALAATLRPFRPIKTALHLYIQPGREEPPPRECPVYIDGIDL
jgi:GNAT superfamily N-acetyltransferase